MKVIGFRDFFGGGGGGGGGGGVGRAGSDDVIVSDRFRSENFLNPDLYIPHPSDQLQIVNLATVLFKHLLGA